MRVTKTRRNVPKDLIESQNHFLATYGYRTIGEERYDRLNKIKNTAISIGVALLVIGGIFMMCLLQKVYG